MSSPEFGSDMRRREFITLLSGAAAVWPLAARAQQPERVRRILVLMGSAKDDPNGKASVATFRKALLELGWADGRNIRIDYRWTAGKPDRAREYATELAISPPI